MILLVLCSFTALAEEIPNKEEKTYPTIIPAPQVLKKTGVGEVTAIIDAIRLQLRDGRIIELSELDIPDMFQREPGDITLEATKLLKEIFLNKKVNIYQNPDARNRKVNRMGHHVAHITLTENDLWAQGALIAEGLARVRTTTEHRALAPELLELEQTARENIPALLEDEGSAPPLPFLWRDQQYKILDTEQALKAVEGFQIVEGTIKKAAIRQNRIYLNFGDNWRYDFTLGIKPESRRLFSKEGHAPLEWRGKTVRVRGWLREYNGPYIEVDHPERIEFIEPEKKEPDLSKAVVPPIDKEIIKDALPDTRDIEFNR